MPSQGFIPINFNVGPWSAQKKPPQTRGLLLVSATPHIGKPPGWGTGDGGGVPIGSDGSPNLGPQELLLGCKELF